MSIVYVGGASIDENGRAMGGKAGNQTGRELRKQAWYLHSKGWRVFRAKDAASGKKIADDMRMAIANANIGYDQAERNTLYKYAKEVGFDCSKVKTPCETDCSALVRVCCAYAGITELPADFRTDNEPVYLIRTGEFVEMTGEKYTKESAYLREGDILVTATKGHTVVVLNNGDKAETSNAQVSAPAIQASASHPVNVALTMLKKGARGIEVRSMQALLRVLGYGLGSYGVDGDFGKDTESAVKQFQKAKGIEVDGVVGKDTWTKLIKG